jgi:hypothetical protein
MMFNQRQAAGARTVATLMRLVEKACKHGRARVARQNTCGVASALLNRSRRRLVWAGGFVLTTQTPVTTHTAHGKI